jgi:predicted transcriptional regulator
MLGYEIAAKEVIPAVRLALIKELKTKYNIKEEEISSYLGITQAAVSKYIREKYSVKIKDIEAKLDRGIIESYAKEIASGKIGAVNLCICKICTTVNNFGCSFASTK